MIRPRSLAKCFRKKGLAIRFSSSTSSRPVSINGQSKMSCLYDNYIRSIEQTSLAFFDTSIVHVVKYSCDGYYSLPLSKPAFPSNLHLHEITKVSSKF